MSTPHEHPECDKLLHQLSDYIDGTLEASICAELEAHLSDCSDCRVMVDTVRRTITLYRAGAVTELPSGVEQRLLQVLRL